MAVASIHLPDDSNAWLMHVCGTLLLLTLIRFRAKGFILWCLFGDVNLWVSRFPKGLHRKRVTGLRHLHLSRLAGLIIVKRLRVGRKKFWKACIPRAHTLLCGIILGGTLIASSHLCADPPRAISGDASLSGIRPTFHQQQQVWECVTHTVYQTT